MRTDQVAVSAANTSLTGSGTVPVVATAGTNAGTRIDLITIQFNVASTAGFIRLFVHNGSAFFLWKEIPVTASGALSATVAAFRYDVVRSDGLPVLILPATYSLRASTHNAEASTVSIQGWDY
jgi:hypothetical protein